MKSTLFSLPFLIAFPCLALAEPDIMAKSKIDAVTVFADRAQVSRSATVQLKAGSNSITITGLPRLMADESLRVEGRGSGHARIAGVTIKNVYLERAQEQRVHELEDQITAVTRQIDAIEARRKGLIAEKAFLESVRVGYGERISKEIGAGKPATAEIGQVARFVGDGVGKVEGEIDNAEAAKKPLLDRLAALKNELGQSKSERMKEVRAVQVAVEAEREMPFVLNVSYLVRDARWQPVYDIRLLPDGREAELVYRAQIWQKTGEDWPPVRLSLSTAKPEVGGAPPEMPPWHVAFYQPPRPLLYRAKSAMLPPAAVPLGGAPSAPAAAADQAMEQAEPLAAEVEEGQTSVLFNVRQPVTVAGDGTRVGSVIDSEKVPVALEYVTTPKLTPRVYLKSQVINNTPYPLLAGEANVYNGTIFTGKTFLKTITSGEKFDLYFGADEQIKVKRDVEKVRKQGGVLGSSSVTYHCSVELQNFKKVPVTVSLMDQLPLSGDAEIKVKLEDASQKPEETKADGTIVWKVPLDAGQKKRITYDIVIAYPKGRELTGI